MAQSRSTDTGEEKTKGRKKGWRREDPFWKDTGRGEKFPRDKLN